MIAGPGARFDRPHDVDPSDLCGPPCRLRPMATPHPDRPSDIRIQPFPSTPAPIPEMPTGIVPADSAGPGSPVPPIDHEKGRVRRVRPGGARRPAPRDAGRETLRKAAGGAYDDVRAPPFGLHRSPLRRSQRVAEKASRASPARLPPRRAEPDVTSFGR